MYFKTENLNYDEKKYVSKLSDLLNWARQNNRQDIIDEADKYGTITKPTNLLNAFYKLSQMKKTENKTISSKSIPVMENNTNPNPEPDPKPTSNPAPDPTSFDPLLGANPMQRDYTSGMPNSSMGAGAPLGNIPEPNFQSGQSTMGGFGQVPPNVKDERFANTQDLPPNEKNKSSEELAKMLVDAYAGNVPKIFSYFSKIKESKLQNMARNGELELNLVLRPSNLTIQEYVKMSNSELDRAFEVSPEWKAEITPVLHRVLSKRNWGVTDEQILGYYVASHLIQCSVVAAQVVSNNNKFLAEMAAMTQSFRESGNLPNDPPMGGQSTPPPPPSAPTPPPPPPAEPEIITPEVEIVPNEFINEVIPVIGMDSDPLAPKRFETPRRGRPNNAPPSEEMEDMPNAGHITSNIQPLNPIR